MHSWGGAGEGILFEYHMNSLSIRFHYVGIPPIFEGRFQPERRGFTRNT